MFRIKILVVLILYLFTQFIGNSNVKCEDDLSSFTEGAYFIPNTENNDDNTWVWDTTTSYDIDLDMEKPSQWRWHFKNEKGKEELKKLIDLLEDIYESPQPINQ